MKNLLVCLGIFLLINTSAFSQGYKKASVAEIKKMLIGKTVKGNSTVLTFNKNGTLKGVFGRDLLALQLYLVNLPYQKNPLCLRDGVAFSACISVVCYVRTPQTPCG